MGGVHFSDTCGKCILDCLKMLYSEKQSQNASVVYHLGDPHIPLRQSSYHSEDPHIPFRG